MYGHRYGLDRAVDTICEFRSANRCYRSVTGCAYGRSDGIVAKDGS
jgi:hypothetical protein